MNAAYLGTPDLCTSGLVCKAAGPLIRILSGGANLRVFATFGAVLGLAYFSKTIMFLVAFAFLASAGRRRVTILAFACIAVVALPGLQRGRRYIRHGSSTSLQRYANLQPRSAPPTRLGTMFVSDAWTPQHFVSALPTTNSQEGGWQNDSETDFWRETSE
jgi:hypothetical protein